MQPDAPAPAPQPASNDSPLAGTWRFEVRREGGPVHVLYARTSRRRWWVLPRLDDSEVFPREHLDVAVHRAESRLPPPDFAPGEGGRPGNAHAEVRLAGDPAPDGSLRFIVWIDPLVFSGMVSDEDPELNDWLWDHLDASLDEGALPAGEAVLHPDGRATWTQEMRIADGRVVTLRGERISGVAYAFIPDSAS